MSPHLQPNNREVLLSQVEGHQRAQITQGAAGGGLTASSFGQG